MEAVAKERFLHLHVMFLQREAAEGHFEYGCVPTQGLSTHPPSFSLELSYGFNNSQRPSAKSIILKTSNCITITIDILDMGQDMQTARTQHLFFLIFPLLA